MSHLEDLQAVSELVRAGLATTRREIGKALSLRSTTVSELVGSLVSSDILRENTSPPRGRGRPATSLSFNHLRLAGIVIGVVDRTLVANAVDLSYRVIGEQSITPPPDADNQEMANCIRKLVLATVEQLPQGIELSTITLSISGLLDKPNSLWCFTSRWPKLKNLNLAELLSDQPCSIDIIRNLDAELSGIQINEKHARNENSLLLHWGEGIGASYSADGVIVNKSRGRFCEIGHWSLGNAQGKPCTCGNHDCLETVAALWAIGEELKKTFPSLALNEHDVADQLSKVDPMQSPALTEGLKQVLRVTTNLCKLLFPDRVILTGPFVQNPLIFSKFVMAFESASLLDNQERIRVSVNSASMQDEIIGALHQPLESALQQLVKSSLQQEHH